MPSAQKHRESGGVQSGAHLPLSERCGRSKDEKNTDPN
jgi:hypothetical protein